MPLSANVSLGDDILASQYNNLRTDVLGLITSGTKAVFFQAAAPTGWTQDAANNDAALRVVSGSGGGTGGSQGFATHTHVETSHSHILDEVDLNTDLGSAVVASASGQLFVDGGGAGTADGVKETTDSQGGTTAGATLKYIDVIVASKD